MHAHFASRVVFGLWITLLSIATLVTSSPAPEPDPAPGVETNLGAVILSNLNTACQHGCPKPSSDEQLNKNAAFGSAVSPLSVVGGLVLSSGILATL